MNFNGTTIRKVKDQLEEIGYFNDEQFLGSAAVKHHKDKIFIDLRSIGYEKTLSSNGGFYPETGALYWMYDEEMVSFVEATEMSNAFVKLQLDDG